MNDKERLRQRFNSAFEHWEIELSEDAMERGVVWLIVQQGWTIWTRFDVSSEDGREYLDYYAMHRMTNDRHIRWYVDGEEKGLPTIAEGFGIPKGTTEEQEKELEREYFAYNQKVEKLLAEKGFVMTKDAHGSAQINRFLQTNPDALDRE